MLLQKLLTQMQFIQDMVLSENAKILKICEEHGIKFIGASPEMIDQIRTKHPQKQPWLDRRLRAWFRGLIFD
jgi:biotin carboxylase